MEALKIQVVDPLIGSFRALTEGIAGVVNWNPELAAFVVQSTAGVAAIAGAVKVVGFLVSGVKSLGTALAIFKLVNPEILAVSAALSGVVLLMSQLIGDGNSFGERFASFFGKVAEFIEKGVRGLREMLGLIERASPADVIGSPEWQHRLDESDPQVVSNRSEEIRRFARFGQAVAPDSVMGANNSRFNPKFADALAPDSVMGGADKPEVAMESKKQGRTRRSAASFVGIEELANQLQTAVLSKEDKVAKDNLAANKKTAEISEKMLSAMERQQGARFG